MRLISFFLLAGMVASAAPITTTVTLTNAGNPTNVIHDGVYIGPYTLTINGQDYAALCIDYRDESDIGSSWSAYLTPVAGGNFAHTYHGSQGSNAQVSQEYEEEAYLFSQITKPGTTDQQRIDIQEAAWFITDPSYTPDDANAQHWINLAQANYNLINLNGYEIVSSVNAPHQQEFMIITPVPEASTWSLIVVGSVFCAAGLLARQRRGVSKAAALNS